MVGFRRTRTGSSAFRRGVKSTSIAKKILPSSKIYIVQEKLAQSTISKLVQLAENHAQLCKKVEDAGVVITGIGMRRRLERHIPPDLMKEKAVVTPEWLQDSIKNGQAMPYNDYAALNEGSGVDPDALSIPTRPASPPTSNLDYTAKLACQRASPLVCINQDLVSKIDVIRRWRELDDDSRSALSYSRAIAALKACPYEIKNVAQACKLPYLGPKIASKIEEYLAVGYISETETILKDEKYRILNDFTSIYGIGPVKANALFAQGLRTFDDLERYYKVQKDLTTQRSRQEVFTVESWIEVSLALKEDLSIKIPRKEVEEIRDVIMQELDEIQPGCSHCIAGGYRRGKQESGDVDIIITHQDVRKVKGLCKKATERLCNKGLMTHLMTLTGQKTPATSNGLEKALTIFRLPGTTISRRLDLIFADPNIYWAAVVGWTGSAMFERDLRLHAKSKHLKFDSSGITHRSNNKQMIAHSEKEIFDILGLEWVDPTLRNADA